MPRLTPCPACHAHVRGHERVCPHCDARLPGSLGRGGAIALVGLALAGCPSGGTTSPDTDGGDLVEPEYGVPDTGEPMPEPEYGVPETSDPPPGEVAEPEYGVAATAEVEG